MAALRDLFMEPLVLPDPDPPATAAAWNACNRSGLACHTNQCQKIRSSIDTSRQLHKRLQKHILGHAIFTDSYI
jgi:hypothetical protein